MVSKMRRFLFFNRYEDHVITIGGDLRSACRGRIALIEVEFGEGPRI